MKRKPTDAEYQFWKALPLLSSLVFFGGVFCLFAGVMLVLNYGHAGESYVSLALSVAIGGLTGAVFAFLGVRRMFKTMIALVILEFVVAPLALSRWQSHSPASSARILSSAALNHALTIDAAGATTFIILGYLLMVSFIGRQGRKYFRMQSEIKLAGDIHHSLVPEISRRIGNFEFYGASVASGMVGGDLFDIVEQDGKWFSYVADVSGHGVPAGVLMAMVKSATRMKLNDGWRSNEFLDDLNKVLQPLQQPDTFVTFSFICSANDGQLEFSLAGHLPILHFRAGVGEPAEHSVSNLPLGILGDQQFESSKLAISAGDLLVILTDGLPETFDGKQRELGMDQVKRMIAAAQIKPLKEIFETVRAGALQFGKQIDDQTMLLIRYLEK